jgi:threonine/homoserine/homoserine lactone efflux protein
LALGYVAAIPIGPVNAAVIDTAFRKSFWRALAIGIGGAFADLVYSQVAVAGLAPVINNHTTLAEILFGIGGVALVIFGIVTVRTAKFDPECVQVKKPIPARAFFGAVGTGILITMANPAALVSWVFLASFLAGLTRLEAFIAGLGIFAGTALWFLGIAYLAHKGRVRLGHRTVWVTRTVGALLVAYGVFLVGKASMVVWAHAVTVGTVQP